MHPSSTPGSWWSTTMQASLVALMLVSLGLMLVAPVHREASGIPPGIALAVVKLIAFGFVLRRIRSANRVANIYSMQWSSMFILLFFAEGAVRATSDPYPANLLGLVEAIVAAVYFVAVLAFLRPIKKQARADRASS